MIIDIHGENKEIAHLYYAIDSKTNEIIEGVVFGDDETNWLKVMVLEEDSDAAKICTCEKCGNNHIMYKWVVKDFKFVKKEDYKNEMN